MSRYYHPRVRAEERRRMSWQNSERGMMKQSRMGGGQAQWRSGGGSNSEDSEESDDRPSGKKGLGEKFKG